MFYYTIYVCCEKKPKCVERTLATTLLRVLVAEPRLLGVYYTTLPIPEN